MLQKPFTRSDGTEDIQRNPEHGDKVISMEPKVREYENLAVVKGKPVKIFNRVLRVKLEDGTECDLRLTGGQKKVLDKEEDLTGKEITFEEYDHKLWGKLVGARVKK